MRTLRKSTRPGANGVVEISPFEFLDRLADLVPPPRISPTQAPPAARRTQFHCEKYVPALDPLWDSAKRLECPACGVAFITEPGPIRKILTHLGKPLEPPPVSPARGPPTDWGELVQVRDDRSVIQSSPDELPAIDIHSL